MDYKVFVSHSSADRSVAEAVCTELEHHDICCWMAPRDIEPGAEWGSAIVAAIEQCPLMVLVYSRHSNSSPQVKRELERAVHLGRPIVPFCIDDSPLSKSLQYFISSHHWLDALTPPLAKHLPRLTKVIQRLLTGGAEGDALAQQYIVQRSWRLSLRQIAALAIAAILVIAFSGYTFFAVQRATTTAGQQRQREQTLVSDAREKSQRYEQEASELNARIEAATLWSAAQDHQSEAAKYMEAGNLARARERWEAAAEEFAKAAGEASSRKHVVVERDAFQHAIRMYRPWHIAQKSPEWKDLVILYARAETAATNGAYDEAVARFKSAQDHILACIIVQRELKRWTSNDIVEMEFRDVLSFLIDSHSLDRDTQFAVDPAVLERFGLAPVTLTWKNEALGLLLKSILERVDSSLDFTLRDKSCIYVSTKEQISAIRDKEAEASDVRMSLSEFETLFSHRNRALAFLEGNDPDSALSELAFDIKDKPSDFQARMLRAEAYYLKGDHDAEVAELTKAISLNSGGHGYYERGTVWLEKGDDSRAIEDFTKAIEIAGTDASAQSYRARSFARERAGDIDGAIADLTSAIKSDGKNVTDRLKRGRMYSRRRDYREAVDDLEAALKLSPENVQALNSLAWIFATCPNSDLRNGRRAVELASRAIELADNKAIIADTLAAALAEAGEFESAVKLQTEVVANPDLPSADKEAAEARLALYQKKLPYHELSP